MTFQYDHHQDFQLEAIASVVRLFEGQALPNPISESDANPSRPTVANSALRSVDALFEQALRIQKEAGLAGSTSSAAQGLNFSVEMETGTGKTYVYLRTAFELHARYGYSKFIIVVPSVAIREGVVSTLRTLGPDLRELYKNAPFGHTTFNSRQLSQLRTFVYSHELQFLVINIDSFNKQSSNVVYRDYDRFGGRRPIDMLQSTRPVVIIDEPQNVESQKARSALKQLNPLCTLRYSATHRHRYNLLYRLGPAEAFHRRLVKRVVVAGSDAGRSDDSAELARHQLSKLIEVHILQREAAKRFGNKVLSLVFVEKVQHYRRYTNSGHLPGPYAELFEELYTSLSTGNDTDGLSQGVREVHAGYFSADRRGQFKNTSGRTQADEDTYALIMRDKERLLSLENPVEFIFSHSALSEGWDNPNVFQICMLRSTKSRLRRRQIIGRGLRLPVNQLGSRVRGESLNRLVVIANEAYSAFAKTLQQEIETDTSTAIGRVPRDAFQGVYVSSEKYWGHQYEPISKHQSARICDELQKLGILAANGTLNDADKELSDLEHGLTVKDIKLQLPTLLETLEPHRLENIIRAHTSPITLSINREVADDYEFLQFWEQIAGSTTCSFGFTTASLIEQAFLQLSSPASYSKKNFSQVTSAIPEDTLQRLQQATDISRSTLAAILHRMDRLQNWEQSWDDLIAHVSTAVLEAMHELSSSSTTYQRAKGSAFSLTRLLGQAGHTLGSVRHVLDSLKSPFHQLVLESQVSLHVARRLEENPLVKYFVRLPPDFGIHTPRGSAHPQWALKLYDRTANPQVFDIASFSSSAKLETAVRHSSYLIDHFACLGVDYRLVDEVPDFRSAS